MSAYRGDGVAVSSWRVCCIGRRADDERLVCARQAGLEVGYPPPVENPLLGDAMAETRRKFNPDFHEGAMCMVRETGLPIPSAARRLDVLTKLRRGRYAARSVG